MAYTKRQRTSSAPTFPSSPALDGPTLGALQSAIEGPNLGAPAVSLHVISTMLSQTASEVKRKLEAATKPSRESVRFGWCLEDIRGRDDMDDVDVSGIIYDIYMMNLSNVSMDYLITTPNEPADVQFLLLRFYQFPTIPSTRDATHEHPSWDSVELLRIAIAAEHKRLCSCSDCVSDSDDEEASDGGAESDVPES
jgi:hypothetical protein